MKTNLFSKFIVMLTALVAMGMSGNVWAGQAYVYAYSSPQQGGYVYVGTEVGAPSSFTKTKDDASIGGFGSSGDKTFYLYYKVNDGYKFQNWYKTNQSNYDNATTVTNTSDLTAQGQQVKQSATGFGAQNSYYAAVFTPITYTMIFHGNGNTAGSMANQTYYYDAQQALRSNAFVNSYTIQYDANEGTCAQTEETCAYTFLGWAGTADGEVIYSDGQVLKNLTTVEGTQYDLYAIWQPQTITLPEPTREGFLFDGWYVGENWVGTVGTVITPTEDMQLTAHWAERLTPIFVLDDAEIELEQTAHLVMDNVSNPTIEIAPEGIVSFNAETGALTALQVGTVTISATQEETETLSYKHEELTLTVTKKNPMLTILMEGVARTSMSAYQGSTVSVEIENSSDAEVVVSNVSGAQYASYASGVMTAGAVGTAVYRAAVAETDTYQAKTVEFSLTVIANNSHLPVNDQSYTLGNGSATDWTHKYVTLSFQGVPDKLSFNYAYIYQVEGNIGNPTLNFDQLDGAAQAVLSLGGYSDARKGVGNTHMLYVEESADGNTWTTIWTNDDASNMDTHASGDIQLSRATRHLRFHHSCNFSNSYSNIKVTELKYVEDPIPASIDFGTAVINTGEVTKTSLINWCNISTLNVTCSNPRFTVTPTSFGNFDTYGSQTLTISYTHTGETGLNEGDIIITNGVDTKTIHVSATTSKRQQTIEWNADLAATGFAMNTGEQYPDALIPVVATATNGERVTFTSDNPEVIEVIADTALLAKAVGTVNITAYQAGDNEYDEVSDTKQFVVTELLKQMITWEQSFLGLLTTSEPVALTATATSGGEIVYSSADENVVTIVNGVLSVVGEGETYITASQAGGEIDGHEYLPVELRNYVIVRNPASQCNGMALVQASLTLNGSKKEQVYDLSGIPAVLTFNARHGEKSSSTWGSATYSAFIVEQYIYQDGLWDWHEVYNNVVGTSDTPSGNITLDESATRLRLRTLETGTDHTISDIRVSRAKFLRADFAAIEDNAEFNTTWTKKVTVSHSNIDLMTLSMTQGVFALSQATLGEGCDDFSDDEFIVSFTPHEKNVDFYDTIVITDNKEVPSTLRIPVHIFTTGLNQNIHGFELPASCLTTDVLEPFHATATSELEVAYLSSDSTIAYVDENKQLIILAVGTVSITAYQAGDNRYEPASEVKTITISLTPVEIKTAPTASEIAVGQALSVSKLSGGEASVDGSFAWQTPEVIPEAGEQTYTVIFTPANPAIYASASAEVTVHVENGQIAQAITWDDIFPELFYYGMSFEMTATASSELPVEYTSSDETIARVEGTTLIPVSAGTVTITATQAGNEFYFAAEPVEKQLIVSPIPTTYGEYQASFCDGDSVEFAGKWYTAATEEEVTVSEKNIYGGDSVVTFTATVLPRHLFAEDATINMDEPLVWREKEYGLLTPGAYTLYDSLKNIDGCDSVYALQLTVNAIPYLIQEVATACQNEEGEWRLKTLPTHEAGTIILYDSLQSQYGTDSVYELTLTVYPSYAFEDEAQTIYVGQPGVWREIDLSLIPVGDTILTKVYTTVTECDSVYTMHLTVNEAPATYGVDSIYICGRGEVAFYDNVEYSKPSKTPLTVTLSTPNQFGGDSIVELWVLASNKYEMSFSKTITAGAEEVWQDIDLSLIPAGDTTLTVTYATIHGCDSTLILNLTVLSPVTTGINTIQEKTRPAEKFFLNGQLYIRKDERLYTPQGALIETKKED